MRHGIAGAAKRWLAGGLCAVALAGCTSSVDPVQSLPLTPPTAGATAPAQANRAPTITGSGAATVTVGQGYSFTPSASDPDGNRLSFTATGRPAWLALDAATGTLSGTPTAANVGTSAITLTVSDGSLTSSITFSVTVTSPTNRAPTISGSGTATLGIGQDYAFTPTASDPDGNPLTFTVAGKPAWLAFNASNGALSGRPASTDVGMSTITIAVSDGVAQAALTFTVTVSASAPPPPPPGPTNRPPTISGNGTATVTVGQPYAFTPSASDPDGQPIAFAVFGKPSWASFSTSTGTLAGTPGAGDVGVATVTIAVSDGQLTSSISFVVTVKAANRPPTLSGSGSRSVTVGEAYSFTPTSADPDGDRLTFTATGRPAWLALDPSTGKLSGTPAAGDVGSYPITLVASDGQLQATLALTVSVAAANRAPTISGDGTRSVTVGSAYAFTPTASDPDANPLTFTVAGKPAWLAFSASSGTLSGTPAAGDVGSYPMTITVSDGSLSASLNLTVTVAANGTPTISGSGTRTVTVGEAYSFTPTAADPEGAPLSFTVAGKPAWLAFDAASGSLSGTPAAGDVGSYPMTITVSDGALSASLALTVTVTAANRAPTISGSGTRSIAVGDAYAFRPTASDPDGNPLSFSVTGRPGWLVFNTSTGELTGTPAAGDAGSYPMTITVSDGTLSASLTLTVTVVAANRPPTISGDGTRTITVGEAYAFTPTASDPDGTPLGFTITGRPAWLTFSTTTGALSGTPTAAAVGTYPMTITASDGTLTASLSVTVTVRAANRAPTISGSGGATVMVGSPYAFTPTATDPDGDALTFSITGRPGWATFNATTGRLAGTPAAGDVNTYAVTITVSDGTLTASLPFTINVVAATTGSATLSWVAPTTRTDGTPLTGLAGYRIYYGTSAAALTTRIDVTNPSVTTWLVDNLTPGTWYFETTAVDTGGLESARSARASKTVP